MTEAEWQNCEYPFEMLKHLDGKVPDEAFIPFSIACCRRIWQLISDPRARAVIDATEAAATGENSWESLRPIHTAWNQAHFNGEVADLAGGLTNDAVDSVCGLGDGHASQVSISCTESVGYAAAQPLSERGTSQDEQTQIWKAAAKAERLAQSHIIRTMFAYLPEM